MATIPTMRTTTTGRAKSVIPATRRVAPDGRIATAMKVNGSAAKSSRRTKTGMLRIQAAAP